MTSSHAPATEEEATTFARAGVGVLLALCVALTAAAAFTLELGSLASPGPGLWILAVAAFTTILTVAALLGRHIVVDGVLPFDRRVGSGVLLALPPLLLVVPMLELLGVLITTASVGFYWFTVVAHASVRTAVVGTLAITAGIWFVFIQLLGVPFSPGSLTNI